MDFVVKPRKKYDYYYFGFICAHESLKAIDLLITFIMLELFTPDQFKDDI